MNEGTSQRLPGSEKLTRPEEIKALGKYLRKIREAYDENTNLDTTLVGTPGKDTGLLVDIEKLPTEKEQAPGNSVSVSLEKSSIPMVEDTEKNISLETKKLNIFEKESLSLSDKLDKLSDSGKNISLEERSINIQNPNPEIGLTDKLIKTREDTLEVGLEKKVLDISDNTKTELSDKIISGIVNNEISDLEKTEKLVLENKNGEPEELYNFLIGTPGKTTEPNLENKIEKITDQPLISLSDKLTKIEKQLKDIQLEKKIVNSQNNDLEVKLENKVVENLGEISEIELGEKIVSGKIEDGEVKNLETKEEYTPVNKNGEPEELYDSIIGTPGEQKDTDLETKKLEIEGKEIYYLGDKKLKIDDDKEVSLGDKKLEIGDDKELDLEDTIKTTPGEHREEELENEKQKIVDGNWKFEDLLGILQSQGISDQDKLEALRKLLDPANYKIILERSDEFLEAIENTNNLKMLLESLSEEDVYNVAMRVTSAGKNASGDMKGWFSKVGAMMSAYLNPKNKVRLGGKYWHHLYNTKEMAYYGIELLLRKYKDKFLKNIPDPYHVGSILYREIAEISRASNKKEAAIESIIQLVDRAARKSGYLPGNIIRGVSVGDFKTKEGAIEAGTKIGMNLADAGLSKAINGGHPFPLNRPPGIVDGRGFLARHFQQGNNRVLTSNLLDASENKKFNESRIEDRYWKSASFCQTLQELCPRVGTSSSVSNLLELKELLKTSPYVSTPGKFTTSAKNSYNSFSLDSNIYWEITMEPYCSTHPDCNNGGFSFLPAIEEINEINYLYHHVITNYGFWIPVNSFELQKTKLITKNLSLYEGEITYPIGMEFTNELRLTFVDDSMKSWRQYFEKCAEVAVYNSIPHNKDYYSKYRENLIHTPTQVSSFSLRDAIYTGHDSITIVDKTNHCVSLYKNITFLITIYVLSPQFNLLKKYPLLCVLKDFSEEYVGELDSGGADLNVSFSIVGECPPMDNEEGGDNSKAEDKDLTKSLKSKSKKAKTKKSSKKSKTNSIGVIG